MLQFPLCGYEFQGQLAFRTGDAEESDERPLEVRLSREKGDESKLVLRRTDCFHRLKFDVLEIGEVKHLTCPADQVGNWNPGFKTLLCQWTSGTDMTSSFVSNGPFDQIPDRITTVELVPEPRETFE